MSFHLSARDIRVEDGSRLVASLQNEDGDFVHAEINLDDFLGNNDGTFEWGGSNFSESADDTYFDIEGGADVPVLRSRLENCEGDRVDANVNLAERIVNENGSFVFV
ncbi:Cyanovirin-N [Aspergillus heterothallicus]